MNFWRRTTKVFAYFSLLFVSFSVAAAQSDSVYRLSAGTVMQVQMDNEINSKVAGANDTFTATIAEPVKIRETVVLPIGTVIEGRITKVRRAAVGGQNGILTVSFEILRFENGEKRNIEGVLAEELKAGSSQTANLLTIAGSTALGGILGAVSKSSNGTLIGAGIGAGAGTGIAFLRKGKEVGIKADEMFKIELTKDVTLPVRDY